MFFNAHGFPGCDLFLSFLFRAFSFHYQDIFSAGFLCLVVVQRLFQSGGKYGLELLGQFSAQRDPPLPQCRIQFLQCPDQMMGCFVEDHGTALGLQFLQNRFLFLFIRRQKSFKAKPSCTES